MVAVVGPTATGKTALGVELAKHFSGEVISCDSMQIYKGLDIGTAKVTPEETCGIPHHGVDILTPDKAFSVADFTAMAGKLEEEISARKKLPILVGGTGLYVQSFLYGVRFTEEKAPAGLREQLAAELAAKGGAAMYEELKQADPEARMCFIGPCAPKKLEASRRTVRSDVDFVLTFEELAGIIEAKDLDLASLEVDPAEQDLIHASAAGRGFAQSGGVAKAVADKIKEWHPDMDVKIASAQGLAECKKLLMLAKAGKYNGYLLEGMGCPGGCIGGAGTIADPARTAVQLNKYIKEAPFTDPEQSAFMSNIHVLKDDPDFEL